MVTVAKVRKLVVLADDITDEQVSAVLPAAYGKITNRLGSALTAQYNAMADTIEKMQLETAECYYAVALLSLSLQQFVNGKVVDDSTQFGDGKESGLNQYQIIKLRAEYEQAANDLVDAYMRTHSVAQLRMYAI